MKKLVFMLALGFGCVEAQIANDTTFNWLVGKWEAQTKEGKFFEYWSASDCMLEAQGGELVKKDTVFKEWLTLTKIKNYWCYIPIVGKQAPIVFALKESKNRIFIFENKEHDFPQQIIYEFINANHFKARVEGKMKGKEMKELYEMKRVE
ncbi:MAG: DUF6265 family protein [Bacteroidota bacterium]|nr:DUF6265 family protein [Bacteroidota bacterium]